MKCKYLVDPILNIRCNTKGRKIMTTYGVMIFCEEHIKAENLAGRI